MKEIKNLIDVYALHHSFIIMSANFYELGKFNTAPASKFLYEHIDETCMKYFVGKNKKPLLKEFRQKLHESNMCLVFYWFEDRFNIAWDANETEDIKYEYQPRTDVLYLVKKEAINPNKIK